jgi:Uma2 family endonuclease
MASVTHVTTAQQLWEMPDSERFELVEGELVSMSPPGFDHGCLVLEIAAALREFAQPGRLGLVAVEAGFCLAHNPDTVRSPDVAYVRAERIPPEGVRAFFEGAPDLAVEVISPSDRASDVLAKAQEWLQAGCVAVWVVDPGTKSVTVYYRRPGALFLSSGDELTCEELLPGFRLALADVFRRQT